jgi:hypothetical protein
MISPFPFISEEIAGQHLKRGLRTIRPGGNMRGAHRADSDD